MRSGETIKVTDICRKEVEINEVVIYPQLNKQKTMFWKVEGKFGSIGYTLCLVRDEQIARDYFERVNNELLEVHKRDLETRF